MERTLSNHISRFIRFGVFELDTHSGELRKAGMRVRLQGQPLQVLVILLERGGGVVTREEVRSRIWPNQSFGDTDHALNKAIGAFERPLATPLKLPVTSRLCHATVTDSSERFFLRSQFPRFPRRPTMHRSDLRLARLRHRISILDSLLLAFSFWHL
jgi:hypothetical protein